MDWILIGNIIGYIAVAFNIVVFVGRRREVIVIMKLIGDSLWVISSMLLTLANPANFTGALIYLIAVIRDIVFYYRYKKKWATHIIWLYVFIALTLISPITSWAGPISLFPAIGSVIVVFAFYSKGPNTIRYLSFVFCGLWLIYAVQIGNIPLTISKVLGITSSTIGLIVSAISKKRESALAKTNLPLDSNDNTDVAVNNQPNN